MSENNAESNSGMNKGILWGAIAAVGLLIVLVFAAIYMMGRDGETAPPPTSTEIALEVTATATPEPEEPETTEAPTEEPTATDEPTEEPEPTEAPTEEPTEEPTPEPTEAPPEPLPPEPQEIEFTAEDGQVLKGRYYPGAANPSPVIVLMHWAPGDMEDWNEIAFWLQNRGLNGTSPNVGQKPWLDASWFPPQGKSYAVFTFSFRGCNQGCSSFSPDGWRMDALAAMKTAQSLEGVNPGMMATFGASIGADGSPNACGPINQAVPNSCKGALSLSPGSYLGIPYDAAVGDLVQESPPKPVWCFYSTGDADSALTCQSATGDHYQLFEWDGSGHGMELIQPEIDPSAIQLILDWLALIGF